jgi:hypothetical protein
LAVLAVYGVAVTGLTWLTRRSLVAWVATVAFFVKAFATGLLPYTDNPETFYREYSLYLYTALQVLNSFIWEKRLKIY